MCFPVNTRRMRVLSSRPISVGRVALNLTHAVTHGLSDHLHAWHNAHSRIASADFDAVTDDFAFSMRAGWRHRMYRAFEAVEGHGAAVRSTACALITLHRLLAEHLRAAPATPPIAENAFSRRTQQQIRCWQQLS
jgi:hypothetical protein